MTKKESIRRRVIELIHGEPWQNTWPKELLTTPMTIGRILAAVHKNDGLIRLKSDGDWYGYNYIDHEHYREATSKWVFVRRNGSEATDDDQSEQTISALHNLLCG